MNDSDPTRPPTGEVTHLANPAQSDAIALPNATQRYLSSAAENQEIAQTHAMSGPARRPPLNAKRVLADLSDQQKTAIDMICLGKVDRVVAEAISVHPKTVTRWRLYHAGFSAELARRRQEVFRIAQDRFRGMLGKAMDSLEQDLSDHENLVRHRAVRAMLAYVQKFEPPVEPIDPLQVVMQHARLLKRAMSSSDPMVEKVYDQEREEAEHDLARLLGDPEKEEKEAETALPPPAPIIPHSPPPDLPK